MKAALGLGGLIITLGIVYFLYKAQLPDGTGGAKSPIEQMDLTGVRTDLLGLAQSERLYLAGHTSYASLEQLQQEGSVTFSGADRRGYRYAIEVDGGKHFKITATPTDPAKAGWPVLTIDETMQITQK
jgi:hypothetical protein